jgi:predicted amidohydrolase YtcJ
MTQKHHDGLGCSCCSPLWKSLIPSEHLANLPNVKESIEKIKATPYVGKTCIFIAKQGKGSIQTLKGGVDHNVEAIAFENGYVKSIGTEQQVRDSLPENTPINYLCDQQIMLPAFLEPHVHILPTAWLNTGIDVSPFIGQKLVTPYSKASMLDKLQSKAEQFNNEEWLIANGLDPSLFDTKGEREITATDLDNKISKDIPVFIMNASMHTAYVNTVALNLYNTSIVNTPNTSKAPNDGVLQEMEQIEPFILLALSAQTLASQSCEEKTTLPEAIDEQVNKIFDTASRRGVTYLHDAAIELGEMEFSDGTKTKSAQATYLKHKAYCLNAKIRIGGAFVAEDGDDLNSIVRTCMPNEGDEYFNLSFIKLISDGSNQGLTGSQTVQYCCDSNYEHEVMTNNKGKLNFDDKDKFNTLVSTANKHGWSTMIHANGDNANNLVINAYAYAKSQNVDQKLRNRIEHASLLSDINLDDMKKLHVSPSFLIGHVGYWGYVFQNTIFGASRSENLDRCKSALNKGMKITLHSDNSVTPIGPLRMMEQSITRVMEGAPKNDGIQVLNQSEQITRFEALKAMTYDAAWQCNMDKWLGSLEVGKCADFVILQQSPLTYNNNNGALGAQGMRDIPVLATYKAGIQTYTSLND